MPKQPHHLRALYEIAVSIGGTLDLNVLAQAVISEYHRKLHCIGSSLVEDSHLGLSIYTSFGQGAKLHMPLLEFLAEIPKPGSGQLLQHIYKDGLHHAIFELPNFGALILSTEIEISLIMQQDLVQLNNNFASACIACLHSKSLQQNQQETAKALQVKKDFLSNVSHELRTPMNAVLGFSSLLLKNKKQERSEEYVQQIVKASNSLMTLINDMLDFNTIESSTTKLVNFSCQLQEEVLDALKPLAKFAELKGINFSTTIVGDANPEIWTDSNRLCQALSRIADNAVKFCNHGDSIQLICDIQMLNEQHHKRADLDNNCILKFSIIDTGSGIPQNIVKTIFDPFHQTNISAQHKHQGAGLGLAICHRIIQHAGGDITILDSQTGCHIEFTWPCRADSREISKKPTQLDQCTFLVVDDNEVNQKVLATFLEKCGSQVEVAENGLVAINLCQQHHFQMIFMDYHMPIMNGIDATQVIRQLNSHYQRIPIIAVTADITPQTRKKCLDAGMNSVVNKPLSSHIVEAFASDCLAKTKAIKENITGVPKANATNQ